MVWQRSETGRRTGVDWAEALQQLRIDPYLVWYDLIDFEGVGLQAKEPLVVQIELEKPYNPKMPYLADVEVPAVYAQTLGTTGDRARFITGRLPATLVLKLLKSPGVVRVQTEMSRVGGTDRTTAVAPMPRDANPSSWHPTWIGIIDDGCPFLHQKYCVTPTGPTRVVYLWDQNRAPDVPGPWTQCGKLGYGRELRVDRLSVPNAATGIDEERIYRDGQYDEILEHRTSHGAGVMDLATGSPPPLQGYAAPQMNPLLDQAADMPIVFVQLPHIDKRNTCCSALGVHVLDGLRYMIDRVETHASPAGERDPLARLVVNLSYGSLAGPHDGSSLLEEAMAELIEERGNLAVVLAAGNTATPDRPTHACLRVGKKSTRRLSWHIQPDDTTDSYLEVWIPQEAELGEVALTVTPPGGVPQEVTVGQAWAWTDRQTHVAGAVFPRRVPNGMHGTMALLALVPTARGDARACAPYGLWQIQVAYQGSTDIEVHVWIERDDLVAGDFRRHQQSYLEDDGTDTVDVTHSFSSFAHGRHTVVVGGYRMNDGEPADYSAEGPSRSPAERPQPDVMAPSDSGVVAFGLRVAGNTSGIVHQFSGTSAAAPSVTRWIANGFANRAGTISAAALHSAIEACRNNPTAITSNKMALVVIDADLNPPLLI